VFCAGAKLWFSPAQLVLQFSFVILIRASSFSPVRVYHLTVPGILPLSFASGARPLFSCSRCFYLPHSLVLALAPRVRPAVRPVIRSAAATASSRFLFAVPSIFWAAIRSHEELARKNMFLSLAPVCRLVLALSLALVIAVDYRFQVICFSVNCCR
jgi:hypothetical protein